MRNLHRVPLRKWRRWSEGARCVFNETYTAIYEGWGTLAPDSAQGVPRRGRRVIAWNAAWIAADAAAEAA